MYNPFDDYKIILEWMEHKEGDTFQHSKDEFVQALRRYADWFETLEDQVILVKAVIIPILRGHRKWIAFSGIVGWVLGSP